MTQAKGYFLNNWSTFSSKISSILIYTLLIRPWFIRIRLSSLVPSGGSEEGCTHSVLPTDEIAVESGEGRHLEVGRALYNGRSNYKCLNSSRVFFAVTPCLIHLEQSPLIRLCIVCTLQHENWPFLYTCVGPVCVSEKWRVLAACLVTCLYCSLFSYGEAGWSHTDSTEHSNRQQ